MGGGIALADLLMTLDQGSLIDELQAEREADLHISALEDVEGFLRSLAETAGPAAMRMLIARFL
mgnify:CR=1 FL=1